MYPWLCQPFSNLTSPISMTSPLFVLFCLTLPSLGFFLGPPAFVLRAAALLGFGGAGLASATATGPLGFAASAAFAKPSPGVEEEEVNCSFFPPLLLPPFLARLVLLLTLPGSAEFNASLADFVSAETAEIVPELVSFAALTSETHFTSFAFRGVFRGDFLGVLAPFGITATSSTDFLGVVVFLGVVLLGDFAASFAAASFDPGAFFLFAFVTFFFSPPVFSVMISSILAFSQGEVVCSAGFSSAGDLATAEASLPASCTSSGAFRGDLLGVVVASASAAALDWTAALLFVAA
mmetsp:Transcript_11911/g.22310  ORF Transcript_11911/g.22310 Transcript_11911/m.22310 type:complete len:293 (-) Transcript_11911:921-1799(-)